jgi:hypothetical protein
MAAGVQSPEGSHFFGICGSMHIGFPGGQNVHGAHGGSPMQCPMQPTIPAGRHWPVLSQAIAIGGGGQPPSALGSHCGLQSAPQGRPWQGSGGGGMHEGGPGAHIPWSLQAKGPGIIIGGGGVQTAPHGLQGGMVRHAGVEAVQPPSPSHTPGVLGNPHAGMEAGQGSVVHAVPQAWR